MRRTTLSSQYEPHRPIGQSFWLLSTMAIAVIIVMGMSNAFSAVSDASEQSYSSQQLIDLANGETGETAPTSTGGNSTPSTAVIAAPTATEADATTSTTTTDTTTAGATTEAPQASPSTTTSAASSTDAETTASTTTAGTTTIETAPSSTTSAAVAGLPGVDERGQTALDTISYPWQQLLPGWTISFLPEKSGLYGLTMVPEKKIEIYVRKTQSTALLAHVIAHELGHAVDVTLNDGPDRRRWEDARGLTSAPWWPGSGATDFSTGAGDFAESFAAWQVGDTSFRSKLGGAPTIEQITLLAELSAG